MISVIVHNWCRSFLIPLFIKSYARQDFKEEELEMIIVDDNSPPEDRFEEYLKLALNTLDIKQNLWFKVRAFKNRDSNGNSGRTANVGVKQSKGDILIFNHTDIFPMHKYTLRMMHDQHKKFNEDNSNNREMLYLTSATLTNEASKLEDLLIPQCNGESPWASAISRKLYYKVGGFDERFIGYGHEDADMGWRLKYGAKDLGWTFIHDPKIVFVHLQQSNMIMYPPTCTPKNSDVVNENIVYRHRWVVNTEKEWGISNNLEEIKL